MKLFLHGADLFFSAKMKAMCDASGAAMSSLRGTGPFREAAGSPALVDLAGRDALAAIAALKAAGAAEAIPNSRLESRLRELLAE
jgi:hypothetical protein